MQPWPANQVRPTTRRDKFCLSYLHFHHIPTLFETSGLLGRYC